MFLWVETAIPYPLRHPTYKDKLQEMTSFVDSINTPILTGFADYEVYDKKNKISNSSRKEERIIDGKSDTINFDYFNSAGLFIPKFGLSSIYHKTQLVPFGERIPFIDAIPSLSTMLTWGVGISSWGLGSEVLNLKPVSYTHLRAHETVLDLVCRLLLEKKKQTNQYLHVVVTAVTETKYTHTILSNGCYNISDHIS